MSDLYLLSDINGMYHSYKIVQGLNTFRYGILATSLDDILNRDYLRYHNMFYISHIIDPFELPNKIKYTLGECYGFIQAVLESTLRLCDFDTYDKLGYDITGNSNLISIACMNSEIQFLDEMLERCRASNHEFTISDSTMRDIFSYGKLRTIQWLFENDFLPIQNPKNMREFVDITVFNFYRDIIEYLHEIGVSVEYSITSIENIFECDIVDIEFMDWLWSNNDNFGLQSLTYTEKIIENVLIQNDTKLLDLLLKHSHLTHDTKTANFQFIVPNNSENFFRDVILYREVLQWWIDMNAKYELGINFGKNILDEIQDISIELMESLIDNGHYFEINNTVICKVLIQETDPENENTDTEKVFDWCIDYIRKNGQTTEFVCDTSFIDMFFSELSDCRIILIFSKITKILNFLQKKGYSFKFTKETIKIIFDNGSSKLLDYVKNHCESNGYSFDFIIEPSEHGKHIYNYNLKSCIWVLESGLYELDGIIQKLLTNARINYFDNKSFSIYQKFIDICGQLNLLNTDTITCIFNILGTTLDSKYLQEIFDACTKYDIEFDYKTSVIDDMIKYGEVDKLKFLYNISINHNCRKLEYENSIFIAAVMDNHMEVVEWLYSLPDFHTDIVCDEQTMTHLIMGSMKSMVEWLVERHINGEILIKIPKSITLTKTKFNFSKPCINELDRIDFKNHCEIIIENQ